MQIPWRKYVALGDSLTEGLSDLNAANEPIGWADRFAQLLANRAGEPIEYANLAIRGRLLGAILAEQVEPALALKPDLVTIWGGGNDMLRPNADPDKLSADLEAQVVRFREIGTDVIVGLGFDARDSPIIRATRSRTAIYNSNLLGIARRQGIYLLDDWNMRSLHDWRMWHEDRLHLNSQGHARVAQAALVALGLQPEQPDWDEPLPPAPEMSRKEQLEWNYVWARDHLRPWLVRRIKRTSSGAGRSAKQPTYRQIQPDDSTAATAVEDDSRLSRRS